MASATWVTVAFVIVFVIVLAAGLPATLATVALVMVLPGSAAIGRCPSPTPRMDSGNMLMRDASSEPSAWGSAVTAT